jgi:5-methyltetrahydrofolate--homocysteine methyltransferase
MLWTVLARQSPRTDYAPRVSVLRELLGPTVRIADGGVGTGLQRCSSPGQPPEELALEAPDELVELHLSFIRAGSDIVLTDTFGANPIRLRHARHRDVEAVNRAAVACARRAVELSGRPDVLVAGSLGPTGELLAPLGALDPAEARAAFAAQAAALGDCDLLVVETMFSLDEAAAAVHGCRDAGRLPLVVSFSFDSGAGEPRTMMGHTVADVVRALGVLGVDGIGFNCGSSLEKARATAEEFMRQLREQGLDLPLWVKPNAGIPDPLTSCYPAGPEDMAAFAVWAAELGAAVVGGCCGTTSEHLHEIAGALR